MNELHETRLNRQHWAALYLVVILALLPGFFTTPTMDRDEARYSQAATQMMETGDYIDIRFQDAPRHVKPVGIYWMQVATSAPFGGPDAPIWAFRLPSLLSIFAAVGLTAWLGASIGGRKVGLIAGVAVGLSLAAAVEGRTAKTDAALLAAAVMAQGALYFLLVKTKQRKPVFFGAPLIFWLGTGLALLIKGPIVTMVSATTILVYGVWMRDWGVISRLRPLPGIAVAAAIALPWLIAINIVTDGGFFMESVGHALLGKVTESDDSHAGPIGYHTLLLPITFFPAALLLGLAGAYAWMTRREATTRFLIAWWLPTWIIFELVATKLPHYTLPTWPALGILTGLAVLHADKLLAHGGARWAHRVWIGLFCFVCVVLGGLPLIAVAELGGQIPVMLKGLALMAGLACAAIGAWAAFRPTLARLRVAVVPVLVLYWALLGGVIPAYSPLWPSHSASALVAQLEGCETLATATAGYPEPSNVFWFGTDTVLTDGAGAAQFLNAGNTCAIAIVDTRERAAFDAALATPTQSFGTVTGTNTVKGRELALEVIGRADAPLTLNADLPRRAARQ